MNTDKTVREFATEIPNATRIFENLGIDYCCGGSKPLSEACRQANVSLDEVLHRLEDANVPAQDTPDFQTVSLTELIAHIVATHHGYVKQEVPRLTQLLVKVVSVHGLSHPELAAVQTIFDDSANGLLGHIMKEEMILFPFIKKLEAARNSGAPAPRAPFGSLANPIRMMEMEHAAGGKALQQLRDLTNSYTPPESACFSYKTLYAALRDFEADLHQHVHLENNILFPRAIAMESQV
jgi:regulator of cell morphogenesis and NO signaling